MATMMKQVDPKSLEKTVRDLRRRAQAHREYIEGHETRTRVLLIDPLLRALGWDPENPDEVQLEFKLTSGLPDYALMKDGRPIAVIEAKKLGTRLSRHNPGQVIKYTNDTDFVRRQLVAFTNGSEWVFFRESNKWEPESVDLASGEPFKAAYDLVNCLSAYKYDDRSEVTSVRENLKTVLEVWDPVEPLPAADCKRKPAQLKFEDGSELAVTSWAGLWEETCKHVLDKGLVKPDDFPVVLAQSKQVKKCVMNTVPVHPHGRDFGTPKEIREGIWLEKEFNSNMAILRYSIRLLERFGVDPMTVQIAYAPPTIESGDSPDLT